MEPAKILVIGSDTVVSIVDECLGPNYGLVTYKHAQRQGNSQTIDWGADAIGILIKKKGRDYSALLVDWGEIHAVQAARDAGFAKPIIGIVSDPKELMQGTDRTVNLTGLSCDSELLNRTLEEVIGQEHI